MAAPDPTPAFLRFRASADPKDLAVVFDATAAELLRVASHLVRDLHAAEDIVQSTFLSAIESRQRFTPGQPVLPWLLGILTNQAHRHRARVQRRPDPERVAHAAPAEPDQGAAEMELSQAVSDAIQRLPEAHRPVLILHLRHGLAPQDIALALGRPPGSVRSQLARGLERLRRALPAGFAATISLLIAPTKGLAAVRTVVLGAAEVAAPIAATTIASTPVISLALGGALLMKKTSLVLVALLSLASLTYLVWPDAVVVDEMAVHPPSVSRLDSPPANRRLDTSVDAPRATAIRDSDRRPAPLKAASTITVRGRCMATESDRPLAGCEVRLRGALPSNVDRREHLQEHGQIRWTNPPAVVTSADGRFELVFAPPPEFRLEISIRCEGRVRYEEGRMRLAAGEVLDYGDVSLPSGCRFGGSVVDENGAAQTGVRLSIHRNGPTSGLSPAGSFSATTDRAGRFTVEEPLIASTWSIEVYNRELLSPSSTRITQDDDGGQKDVRIRVRDESTIPSIRGAIVDAAGHPLGGVSTSYFPRRGRGTRRQSSQEDGSFVIKQHRTDHEREAGLQFTLEGYERKQLRGIRWGTKDLQVVMELAAGIDLRVVDGVTGSPIVEFGVIRYFRYSSHPAGDHVMVRREMGEVLHRGHHEAGRVSIAGLQSGKWTVVVVPADPALSMSEPHTIDVAPSQRSSLVVQVFPLAQRQVFVHFADGRPVRGSRIDLAESFRGGPVSETQMLLDRLDPRIGGTVRAAWRIDSATTETDGTAIVRGSRDRLYTIRVTGQGHRPTQAHSVRLDPDLARLDIEVNRGATLRGTLRPLAVLRQYRPTDEKLAVERRSGGDLAELLPAIVLKNLDATSSSREHPRQRGFERSGVVLADDGRFEITGIPPGSWRLVLQYVENRGSGHSSVTEFLSDVRNLKDGEVRDIEVDMAPLQRTTLTVSVTVNGSPAVESTAQLLRVAATSDGPRPRATGVLACDADGCFLYTASPGRYWLMLNYRVRGDRRVMLNSTDPILVEPGSDGPHAFSIDAGHAELRLVGEDGGALSGITILAREVGDKAHEVLRSGFRAETGADGAVRSPLCTAGSYELRIWPEKLNPKAREAISRKGARSQLAAQILIGTIVIEPGTGDSPRQDVVVPRSAGY